MQTETDEVGFTKCLNSSMQADHRVPVEGGVLRKERECRRDGRNTLVLQPKQAREGIISDTAAMCILKREILISKTWSSGPPVHLL